MAASCQNEVKHIDENSFVSCQVGKVREFPVILSSLKSLQIKLLKLIY